jgi:hypothetical protein
LSKRYALETIAAAKELYLQDSSLREIAGEISRETGRNASAVLVLKWCRKYGWPEEKAALEARALARVAEETEELREKAMADTVRNQVAAYRTLWERGVSELMNLEITRPNDAIAMVDNGVRGEREILGNAATRQFLIDVAGIIKSEVHNRETLLKIGHRLVELGVKYNLKFN